MCPATLGPPVRPLRSRYDVVVVGARCAGAATALLLARAGVRVLVVDRASYGSDALSTHALMRGAVLQLHRWRVLDRILDAGTPPVRTTTFRYGDREVVVPIRARGGIDALYAPRRTLLDRVLVDAAREAGADVRHRTDVVGLLRSAGGRVRGVEIVDRDGHLLRINGGLVVGADGIRSRVADRAGAETVRAGAHAAALAYGYWSGLGADAYAWLYGAGATGGVIPTNGGEACVFVTVPPERFRAWGRDVEAGFRATIDSLSPALAATMASGSRSGALRTFAGTPGFLRRAHGPGWALVGDAGFFRDPITAHGITDALRDAELLARSVVRGEAALASYERARDALATDMLTLSDAIASFAWDLEGLPLVHEALNATMKRGVSAIAALAEELIADEPSPPMHA